MVAVIVVAVGVVRCGEVGVLAGEEEEKKKKKKKKEKRKKEKREDRSEAG